MEHAIIKDYQERAAVAQIGFQKFGKLSNIYSLLRLGVILVLIIAICFAVKLDDFTIVAVSIIALGLVFTWLVFKQSAFDREKDYYRDLTRVIENEIAGITTRTNLYDDGQSFADDKHHYTADLDIFGPLSLYQMVNRAATFSGREKLAGWLGKHAEKESILERQQSLKEMSSKNSWKLDLQARLIFATRQPANHLKQLVSYLNTPLNLKGERWLTIYIKAAPYLLLALILGSFLFSTAGTGAALLGFVNFFIVFSKAQYIRKTDVIAGKMSDILAGYAIVFEKVEQENWQSAGCKRLADVIKNEETSANIKALAVLINRLNYHLNMIVGFFLNLFFLWDIRQIIAIENWKRANRQNLEKAFEVISEFEALISLAGLHINNPDWAFPQIADGEAYTILSKEIAHPLIAPAHAVKNDYALVDSYNIDIITGSNMAGKSTFLRTIGINTVLALCGAPVCATEMQVSVITIVSYMRIKDSLNESTSTFKAELDRLQMLLAAVQSGEKIFFLIDEMLRGTNSVDKYLGSKAVIEQLISKRGVGLVATHDLQIAQLETKYPDYIRNFYFDIQVSDGEMLFDYKIKDGECKTFNASLLLKRIGIEIEAE